MTNFGLHADELACVRAALHFLGLKRLLLMVQGAPYNRKPASNLTNKANYVNDTERCVMGAAIRQDSAAVRDPLPPDVYRCVLNIPQQLPVRWGDIVAEEISSGLALIIGLNDKGMLTTTQDVMDLVCLLVEDETTGGE